MSDHTRRLTVLVLLAALFALLPSAASADLNGHRFAAKGKNGVSARDYWTPARMAAAKPLDIERTGSPDSAARVPGPLAASGSGVDLTNVRPARAPGGIRPGGKPPYQSGQVPLELQTTFPFSANGRLFGKFPHAGFYSCSATVVASSSQSTILTAGHCLYDERIGYATKIVFVPAYHEKARPFGVWTASFGVASKQWVRGNFNYDYSALKLKPNEAGTIGSVVGEEGIAVNQPRDQVFQAIGYPYNLGKTEQMRNCVAEFAGTDPRDRQSGGPDSGIGCDMTEGASGGGWTIRDANGVPYVNSVTSFGYGGLKNVLFGPYLTNRVFQVVNRANRG